jgi:hypothetical protein
VVEKLLNISSVSSFLTPCPAAVIFARLDAHFADLNGKAGYAEPNARLAVLGAALICQGCDRMLGHYRFCRRPKLMHQALQRCC